MENFSLIWESLERHHFEFDDKSILDITCVICNGILKDAYEGPCGCSYCKKCVFKYLEDGSEFCPSKDCQMQKVLIRNIIVQSNSSNKKVSRVTVKCPFKLCEFRCTLSKMTDHLRVCNNRSLCCLYTEIGCANIEMNHDELSNHMLTDFQNHNKLLIDSIFNLKNEVATLVSSRQTIFESEMENLIQLIQSKISKDFTEKELIDQLGADVKDLKEKVSELFKITTEIKTNFDQKIKDCIESQHHLITSIKESFDSELLKVQSELKGYKEQQSTVQEKIESSTEVGSPPLELSGSESLKLVAQYKWNISNIAQMRKKMVTVSSEFFQSINKEYQMWLKLYPRGFGDGNHLSIEFRIKAGSRDLKDRWPCHGIVAMTICDKVNPSVEVLASRRCCFEESCPGSEFFHFSYLELEQKKVLSNNSVLIGCIMETDD